MPTPRNTPQSSVVPLSLEDRYIGALLGLACGDALGSQVEFSPRDTFPPVVDMQGGGTFKLAPGQWTDDTSMALCIAESLLDCKAFDAKDIMERFVRWWRYGHLSSTGKCFDIGNTTRQALIHYCEFHEPFSGSTHTHTAGNGSIMRLAPFVLFTYPDLDETLRIAADGSRLTHGAAESIECSQLLSAILLRLFEGRNKEEALTDTGFSPVLPKVQPIAYGAWMTKPESSIRGSGYCIESLEAALWCFHRGTDFRDCVLRAVNLGDDADTTAAITGQLAGAHYGASGIPAEWRAKVAQQKLITEFATKLHALKK